MKTLRFWYRLLMILPLFFFGLASGPVHAEVEEVTEQADACVAYGIRGISQLEKMIYELKKILTMKDASKGVKTLTQASIDKANDALRFYKEALQYADDGKNMSKRDEGNFIKRRKKRDVFPSDDR